MVAVSVMMTHKQQIEDELKQAESMANRGEQYVNQYVEQHVEKGVEKIQWR
jgi:predicted Zn-dependent protease